MTEDSHSAGMSRQAGRDRQLAAVIASAAVMTCFTVYWVLEIQAVREMLKMAYG